MLVIRACSHPFSGACVSRSRLVHSPLLPQISLPCPNLAPTKGHIYICIYLPLSPPPEHAGVSSRVPKACMTLTAAKAPVVMARSQPNHHHHHHHVSSSSSTSTTTASRSLFEISQIAANGYLGYAGGGGGGGPFYASTPSTANHHVKSSSNSAFATTQLLPPAAITPLRLTGREDATRVRLQRQRTGELHRGHIVVGDRIPGFKTSAGTLFNICFFRLVS